MTEERPTCLVFPHEVADGPLNMARDECLLELVSRGDTVEAAFRTYGWTVPTLSLGYFQPHQMAASDPRWHGVPLIRRSTGGGAILHHHEVTYAVAVSRGHPLARRSGALYQAIHALLAEFLRSYGVDPHPRGDTGTSESSTRPFLCFADRSPEDIVIGDVKVIGSAQRRRAGAVLQHGSVLLARATLTPELPGVAELATMPPDEAEVSAWMRRNVPPSLGFVPVTTDWNDETSARVQRIAREVYRNPSWTARR